MKMAIVGLGKMGANMARRLLKNGIEVVGYNRSPGIVNELASSDGLIAAMSISDVVNKLPSPRVVWLMLPSGDPTETQIQQFATMLDKGDVVIDGGNSNYQDSQRRGQFLAEQGIGFMDAGTSGGVWGLKEGYCLMVGGVPAVVDIVKPVLKALAPGEDRGWAHVGPVGAGHFVKMIHNGIEYGMMQAYAEGFALLKSKSEFQLDLAEIAEIWRHGSVVRSWLLDLTAGGLQKDQNLDDIAPVVSDSGEGRWTVMEAINQGVAAPVISLALQMRFASRDEQGYGNRMLAMMRNAFGGHAVFGRGGD